MADGVWLIGHSHKLTILDYGDGTLNVVPLDMGHIDSYYTWSTTTATRKGARVHILVEGVAKDGHCLYRHEYDLKLTSIETASGSRLDSIHHPGGELVERLRPCPVEARKFGDP